MALRIQRPTEGYDWLHDRKPDYKRYFTTIVILGKHEPAWPECTNEEKEEWEREHPAPEPPEDQKTEE